MGLAQVRCPGEPGSPRYRAENFPKFGGRKIFQRAGDVRRWRKRASMLLDARLGSVKGRLRVVPGFSGHSDCAGFNDWRGRPGRGVLAGCAVKRRRTTGRPRETAHHGRTTGDGRTSAQRPPRETAGDWAGKQAHHHARPRETQQGDRGRLGRETGAPRAYDRAHHGRSTTRNRQAPNRQAPTTGARAHHGRRVGYSSETAGGVSPRNASNARWLSLNTLRASKYCVSSIRIAR